MAAAKIRSGILIAAVAFGAGCQQAGPVQDEAANPITAGEIAATSLDGPVEGSAAGTGGGVPAPTAEALAASAAPATIQPPAPRQTRRVDNDVEAPEIFDVRAAALWDGRPSLGGVWVASPDAQDPQRVIMRNPSNGQYVIGALFRRERENPGPPLQISSDAAEALGILAGQPVELSVTALRRAEAPAASPAPAPSAPVLDSPEVVAGEVAVPAEQSAAAPAAAPVAAAATTAAGRSRAEEEEIAASAIAALSAANGAAAPATQAAAPAPAPAARDGDVRVQVGIFAQRANADRAATRLRQAGIASTIRQETSSGKTFWSVIATGAAPRAAFVDKVRAAGFADAYALSG